MLKSIPRSAILSTVGPVALMLTGYLGWRYYGAEALDTKYYALREENIHISDKPVWLRSNVVSEVFQESRLDRMSLLDDQTSAVIAKAFDKHPWVKKTHRVHGMAGGQVLIDAEFRQPLAMVHCESKKETNSDATRSQESFLPIDNDGVLLPTKDFKQEDIPNFLIIYAQDVLASDYPKVGMTIADPQIVEAILLCRLINPLRNQKFPKLTSVYVYPSQEAGKGRWKLELTTKGGPRILWGSAPGHEANSEPLANVKLKRLVEVFIDSKLWSSPEVDLISPASWK